MNTKQVIVMRTVFPDGKGGTMGIRKGKSVAQGSHASMAFLTNGARGGFLRFIFNCMKVWFHKPSRAWLRSSYAKVCVRVDSEAELQEIYSKAIQEGLTAHIIVDSGRTEFGGIPTATAVAIGPDECGRIDKITASLELY